MNKQQYSLREKLSYAFDKSMAAGPMGLIGWLSLVILFIVVVSAAIITIFGIFPDGGEKFTLPEALWGALMRAMDPGVIGGDTGWMFRLVSFVITIAGVFIFSALIGILGSGLDAKLEEMRKGRSRVLENEHTIILNWSPSVFDIISELVIANQSRTKPAIVILADKDKVEMEDEIKDKIEDLGNTQIICRSGDPTDLFDLGIANPETCRSVIVLSPEVENPDSNVIKSILALVHNPKRREAKFQIAAEIRNKENVDVAKTVGGEEVQVILADDFISRIIVQSCRQTGLSAVYSELLDFEGCEIYCIKQPDAIGKTFAEAIVGYEKSTPIGVKVGGKQITLNADKEYKITADDELVIIADDDAAIKFTTKEIVKSDAILPVKKIAAKAEKTLLIGWNHRGETIVNELALFVAKGSELVIAIPEDMVGNVNVPAVGKNLKINVVGVDTTSQKALSELGVEAFDHVLVLGLCDDLPAQAADTNTLITLLNIRKIAEAAGKHISVVSEMIDIRNRELAEITRADDFVVSNKIVSLMLAQASENPNMEEIFKDLLDEEGSEIYVKPIGEYVKTDTSLDFYALSQAALARGEVAIGYRKAGVVDDARNLGGVVINPDKSAKVQFNENDKLIVLSEG